jgi:hypothetical protein
VLRSESQKLEFAHAAFSLSRSQWRVNLISPLCRLLLIRCRRRRVFSFSLTWRALGFVCSVSGDGARERRYNLSSVLGKLLKRCFTYNVHESARSCQVRARSLSVSQRPDANICRTKSRSTHPINIFATARCSALTSSGIKKRLGFVAMGGSVSRETPVLPMFYSFRRKICSSNQRSAALHCFGYKLNFVYIWPFWIDFLICTYVVSLK